VRRANADFPGFSEFFPVPKYQKSVKVPKSANPGGKSGRGVLDVCGNADGDTGYLIRVDGQTVPIGGTSAVSPLWAGLIALLNSGRSQPIGFITPQLYAIGSSNHWHSLSVRFCPSLALAGRQINDGAFLA
jgi:kumamolisin